MAIDEVIDVGNGPKIDLYSEIPMDAQLRAIIEGLKRDSCRVGDRLPGEVQLGERFLVSPRQSVTPRRLLLGSTDVRVRSVRAEIGEAKLFKLPMRSPVLEIRTIEHDVDGQVVWCSTILTTAPAPMSAWSSRH